MRKQRHNPSMYAILTGWLGLSFLFLIVPLEVQIIDESYKWIWYGLIIISSLSLGGFLFSKRYSLSVIQPRSESNDQSLDSVAYQLQNENYKKQIDRAAKIAGLGFWQYFIDEDRLEWSSQVYEMFGLAPNDDITFSDFMEMVHSEDREQLKAAQQRSVKQGNTLNISYRLTKPDGSEGYFRELGEVYEDTLGRERVFGGVIQDITREKQYELELEASETKYRHQFEQAPYGILLSAPDGRIFEANEAAVKMLGYSEQEICALGRQGLTPRQDEKNDHAVAIRRENGFFEGQMTLLRSDGSKFPVYLSSQVYKDEKGRERAIVIFRDLTKLQTLQASLDKEQRLSKTIIENLPGIVTVVNSDNQLLRWNKNLGKELGYTEADIKEKSALDFIHPQEQEKGAKAITKVWDEGYASVEVRLPTKDGLNIPYFFTGVRFETEEEPLMITIGFSRAERESMQTEIRKGQILFGQLFHNAPLAIALVDDNYSIQLVNKAFESIFGYSEQEVFNRNIDELLVPPRLRAESEGFTIGAFKEDSLQVESVRLHKDGREVPVLVVGIPVKDEGDVESIFAMYVDISKRKMLEEEVAELLEREKEARQRAEMERNRIREMFELAPSAIALVEGPEHRFVYANEEYQKMTDHRAELQVPVGKAVPELAEQGFTEVLDEVYTSGNTLQGSEVRVKFKQPGSDNLSERFFNYLYKPLLNTEGKVENIFIEVVDVTEEVLAKKKIQESLDEKVVLLQEIHHRVKNNLALVSSLLQLQKDEETDPTVQRNLSEARNRIYSIAKIHELLYQDRNLAELPFADYTEELIAALTQSNKYPGKEITCQKDLEQVALPINQAIPAGLLLNELISNAYEHAFPDQFEGAIIVRLKKSGAEVTLEVADNGIGMPEDYSQNTMQSLGWTLIKTLVEQLHGDYFVDTSTQGTKITVVFPIREHQFMGLQSH
jgi:PAS domain S-box-containing protein